MSLWIGLPQGKSCKNFQKTWKIPWIKLILSVHPIVIIIIDVIINTIVSIVELYLIYVNSTISDKFESFLIQKISLFGLSQWQ